MDASLISAMSAVLGSLVGGLATVTTTWVAQRTAYRREVLQAENRKREALYGEFIVESSKLLMEALTHTLDKPETLFPVYSLLNRIRLIASAPVLEEAERILGRITDQYFSENLTVEAMHSMARTRNDPLRTFSDACRAEFARIRPA